MMRSSSGNDAGGQRNVRPESGSRKEADPEKNENATPKRWGEGTLSYTSLANRKQPMARCSQHTPRHDTPHTTPHSTRDTPPHTEGQAKAQATDWPAIWARLSTHTTTTTATAAAVTSTQHQRRTNDEGPDSDAASALRIHTNTSDVQVLRWSSSKIQNGSASMAAAVVSCVRGGSLGDRPNAVEMWRAMDVASVHWRASITTTPCVSNACTQSPKCI